VNYLYQKQLVIRVDYQVWKSLLPIHPVYLFQSWHVIICDKCMQGEFLLGCIWSRWEQ